MRESCGFLVRVGDKYLLGEVNGLTCPQRYTVFKGMREEGESRIDCAIRELDEETSLATFISDNSEPFHSYQIKDKHVYVYLLEYPESSMESINQLLKCKSEFAPGKPEISGYKYFTLDELAGALLPSQVGMIKDIPKSA